jgi:hypothetical protein
LAGQLHHAHLIKVALAKQQERLSPRARGRRQAWTKKSQADKPAWPFWLKLSAGGQLEGYFEYVEVVVAAVSFF